MSALPRSRPAVARVNPALTQFVFAFLLVGLLAVVNYGSNIHDHASFTVLSKLCWKNATVRPPLLLVGILAGWAWVVRVCQDAKLELEHVLGGTVQRVSSTLHAALILFCVLLAFHLVHFVASEIPGLTWRPWLMSNVCVHLVFLLLAALPCANVFFGPSRISLIRTVLESAIAPFTQVTFWHVIVADYLTSAAKAFSDLQLTTCVSARIFAVHETAEYVRSTDLWHESYHVCSASGWNAVMLALPFWWRLMQCLKVYSITGESKNLWNALKYSTAFPLVYAGYLKKNYPSALNDRLFVFAAVIQSTYCFIWDVHMDWGLFRLANVDGRSPAERGTSCCGGRPTICRLRRPLLITRSNGAYYAIAVGDMALRFIWALSVFGGVPGRGAGMLFFEVVEIFRRTVWAIFRIEWEVVTKVVYAKHDAGHPLVEKGSPDEDDDDEIFRP